LKVNHIIKSAIAILSANLIKIIKHNKWYEDVCEYYSVSPSQAKILGIRKSGRRPDLPGSATTHPVSGETFEDIWDRFPSETPEKLDKFYKDIGSWLVFRQAYYRRNLTGANFINGLTIGDRFCEYGSGIAPITNWIIRNVPNSSFELTIADVESEHLTFAEWRLKKFINKHDLQFTLNVLKIKPGFLPLMGYYKVITILDVFEHLYNPLDVVKHLTDHLNTNGLLWENYILEEEIHGSNLAESFEQRPLVFDHLYSTCRLINGRPPDEVPGATRCWVKQ